MQARVIRVGQKWEFTVLVEASLQAFKNAIRNLDIFGILENNCDCCDLYRSWFYDYKILRIWISDTDYVSRIFLDYWIF